MTAPTPTQPQAAPPLPAAAARFLLHLLAEYEHEWGATVDSTVAKAWIRTQVEQQKGEGKNEY